MKRTWIIISIVIGLPVLLITLIIIDSSIYPFTSKNPNYKDVESAFSKLQFPSDWQEIDSSENKGIAGRDCDKFNTSGCFHKSKTFKIPESTTVEDVKNFFTSSGCRSVDLEEITQKDDVKQSYNIKCNFGTGLYLAGTYRGPEGEIYISTSTY